MGTDGLAGALGCRAPQAPRVHHLGPAGQALLVNISPPPGGAAPQAAHRRWHAASVAAVTVAVVAVAAAAVAAASGGPPSDGPGGLGSLSHVGSVSAGPVTAVDLQAAPGQLTVVGAATSQARMTGQLHWTGHAPAVTVGLDRATGVLRLSYRCAAASPCTGNYRLIVPARAAIVLRQPAGHLVLSGLAGPLQITAQSADVSATGLRSPTVTAAITSGHLNASFDTPPRQVSVTLTSAQAALRLPGTTFYQVSSQVTAGYVHVGIPRASRAASAVTARISSGELDLLPR